MQPTDPSPGHPMNKLAPKEPGAPVADDHAPMGPPSDETIRRGYEADVYDAKSVISVPLLVILFFVLAFGTVTVIFRFIAYPKPDQRAHPSAYERNKRPLNERLAGIGHDGQGGKSTREQPRLEPLKQRSGGEYARAITRPETAEGNSPELHPEDLRITKARFPELYQTGGGKVPIDKVMDLGDSQLKALFPVQSDGTQPIGSQHVPTAANAGRGADESEVILPTAPEPKKEAKKPEDKKSEDKKPEPPKAPEPPKKPEDKKPEPPKPPEAPKKPEDKKPEPPK